MIFSRNLIIFGMVLSLLAWSQSGLAQYPVSPDNGGISLPDGFRALVIADDIGPVRQLAVRENGDIYAALMTPIDLGYVVALRDTDGDGVMDVIKYFGEIDSQCKSLRIYDDYLYVGSVTQIVRFPLDPNQLLPTGPYETVVSGFPAPLVHSSKNIAFDNSKNLYVTVGTPSNSCQEIDRTEGSPGKSPCDELDRYGGVWMFNADTLDQSQMEDGLRFATGIRNHVAFQWDPIKQALYGVQNGRDNFKQNWGELYNEQESAELPAEEFHLIKQGSDFGWPYVYYDHKQETHIISPEYGGDKKKRPNPGQYDDPILNFPAHWAPVGLEFYNANQFPERYRGGAFVTFHGSWNRAPLPQQGYNVAFVPFDGTHPSGQYEIFADGFKGTDVLLNPNQAVYRPTGVTVGPDGSLYVSEDKSGRVWKISYTGGEGVPVSALQSQRQLASATEQNDSVTFEIDPGGQALYTQHCLACHQADGSGVPNMQPSLISSERLSGDDNDYVLRIMLQGSQWVEDSKFTNMMSSFAYLSDSDIALVLNYAKSQFGKSKPDLTARDIAAMRERYPTRKN
jgi:glucose/arabinose dehydrogenase/mono/diheme cytochrome c family protein